MKRASTLSGKTCTNWSNDVDKLPESFRIDQRFALSMCVDKGLVFSRPLKDSSCCLSARFLMAISQSALIVPMQRNLASIDASAAGGQRCAGSAAHSPQQILCSGGNKIIKELSAWFGLAFGLSCALSRAATSRQQALNLF
jgi:hypothetical protein